MPRQEESEATQHLLTIVSVVVIVAALYLAQAVLIPLALAVLLSFLLAPLATGLEQRVGLWRVPAVLVVSGFAFMVLGGVGWLVADQITDLVQSLPQYRYNIRVRVEAVRGQGGEILSRVTDFFSDLQEDFAPRPEPFEAPEPEEPGDEPDPVPVQVVDQAPSPLEMVRFAAGPLATAGLVVIFTLFILVQRDQLRDRIIRLAGLGRIEMTTKALDDAGRRISKYLLAQVVINVSYGVPVAIGLWIIGLPNALLWGVLAMLVRFIPFVGPWVGALLPTILSLAVFDDWTRPFAVIGMFVVFELFSNNVLEPWLYGASTGISMLAVVIVVVFWTWLWGVIGLVLATPLTVCVMVLGKYVERLSFFDILLSDEPALEPRSRFYQRMLARDVADAAELAEDFFADRSLLEVYDSVMVPALGLAERDRHRDRLDATQQQFIHETMRKVADRLGKAKVEAEFRRLQTSPAESDWRITLERAKQIPIVSVPARDEADEIAALMFAQTLKARGLQAHALPVTSLVGERLEQVAGMKAPIVCLTALPPYAVKHARYVYSRLKARIPDAILLVGLWGFEGDVERLTERIGCTGRDEVVISFAEAMKQIREDVTELASRP